MTEIEGYCRWLSTFFFASGYDRDDLYQEARIAAWLAPRHPRLAARRQVLDCVKIGQRRSLHPLGGAELPDTSYDDRMEARARLRAVLDAGLPPREQEALGRVIRGEPITRSEKPLQAALVRARRRLATVPC